MSFSASYLVSSSSLLVLLPDLDHGPPPPGGAPAQRPRLGLLRLPFHLQLCRRRRLHPLLLGQLGLEGAGRDEGAKAGSPAGLGRAVRRRRKKRLKLICLHSLGDNSKVCVFCASSSISFHQYVEIVRIRMYYLHES